MAKMELTTGEIDMINELISLRRKNHDLPSKLINKLDSISNCLNNEIIKLSRRQCSIICGCVREFVINPNEDLLMLNDFDIFRLFPKIKDRIPRIDIGLSIFNKLKKPDQKKVVCFSHKMNKIEIITNAKKVYFSEMHDGKIYKFGISNSENLGFKVEYDESDIKNFRIDNLVEQEYINWATPDIIVHKLKQFAQGSELTKVQSQVLELIDKNLWNTVEMI